MLGYNVHNVCTLVHLQLLEEIRE